MLVRLSSPYELSYKLTPSTRIWIILSDNNQETRDINRNHMRFESSIYITDSEQQLIFIPSSTPSMSNYACNDIYCQEHINVPFSWEYKPGLSKVTHQLSNNDTRRSNLVLQPPPYRTRGNKLRVEDTESPFICAVHPSSLRISSFRMENPKEEDPFIEAYKKCTKSPSMLKRSRKSQKNNGSWPSVLKYMHILSCKHVGDVISMV